VRCLPETARSFVATADLTGPGFANTAAVVLTGGASTRMGTDKASLVVDGQSMLDRVLATLEDAEVANVVVADAHELPDAGGSQADGPLGPLAGVVAAWGELTTSGAPDPVVVLSCDLPGITSVVVRELVRTSLDHEHGALAHDGERPQPLVAAYRPAAMRELVAAFNRGERSIRRCFGDWDLAQISFAPHLVADADTPADLGAFVVEWPSGER